MTAAGRPVAERIADVVADIRTGRTHHPAATDEPGIVTSLKLLQRAQQPQPVVDCTAIFNSQRAMTTIDLYDHPSITPPWTDALLCYANTFGNIICLQVHRKDWDGTAPSRDDWMTDNDVDWPRVRWIAETAIWVGGRSDNVGPIPTSGPCHMFRHAIHDDGSPADINWLALMAGRGRAGSAMSTLEALRKFSDAPTVTIAASHVNVDIAEPARPRPVRRRIARTGVTVQTIVVRPPGKRRAQSTVSRPIDAVETVLSPVRGHFAHYGPKYNRGLLFGKYPGKFWIPGHVRGAGDESAEPDARTYVLKPSSGDAA